MLPSSYVDPCALRKSDGKKKQKPATVSEQVIKDYNKYILYFKVNKAGTENVRSRFSKFASASSVLRLFLQISGFSACSCHLSM